MSAPGPGAATDGARLAELWARELIRECKALYCHLLDSRRFEELVDTCFSTDQPVVDFTPHHDRVEGIDAVRSFYGEYVPSIREATAHRTSNCVIALRGDHALATWYMQGSLTIAGKPYAVQGVYHDEFRLERGQWRISVLRLEWEYLHRLDESWVAPHSAPCQAWTAKNAGNAVLAR